jgi:hypothetical protein
VGAPSQTHPPSPCVARALILVQTDTWKTVGAPRQLRFWVKQLRCQTRNRMITPEIVIDRRDPHAKTLKAEAEVFVFRDYRRRCLNATPQRDVAVDSPR